MFSFKKTLPTPPPPPKSCKSDKTNVNKSQFLVHWGCNSATPLQQLRSVFCTCFANTDKHTTQSQGPCTASQVKTKRNETKNKPQAPSGFSQVSALPPESDALAPGWAFWEGKKHEVCALRAHPPSPPIRPFSISLPGGGCSWHPPPALQILPHRIPLSQNVPRGWEPRKNRPTGGGRLGKKQVPLPG